MDNLGTRFVFDWKVMIFCPGGVRATPITIATWIDRTPKTSMARPAKELIISSASLL